MNTFVSIVAAILLLAFPVLAQGPGNISEEEIFIGEFEFWSTLIGTIIITSFLMRWFWSRVVEKPRLLNNDLQTQFEKMERLFTVVMAPRSHRIHRDNIRQRIRQIELQLASLSTTGSGEQLQKELEDAKKELAAHMGRSAYYGLTLGDLNPPAPFEVFIEYVRKDKPIALMYRLLTTSEGKEVEIPLEKFVMATQSDGSKVRVRQSIKIKKSHQDALMKVAKEELQLHEFLWDQFSFPQLPMELPGSGPPKSFMSIFYHSLLAKALFTVGSQVNQANPAKELCAFEVDSKTQNVKYYASEEEWQKKQKEFLESVPKFFLGRESSSNIENRAIVRNVVAMSFVLAFFHLITQEEERRGPGDLVDLESFVFPTKELVSLASRYSSGLLDCWSNEKTRDITWDMFSRLGVFCKMIDALPWYHGQESREMASTYVMQA